ncbi:MAG: SUMF1/EgtB/PvdO family nonheme iron enzyme [Anaerolineales bacterium]|nr:SUMF1/EgtB/PvdO family nonheme iron enzyme [Anaerolineales bacterium]
MSDQTSTPKYLTDRQTTTDHLNFSDFRPALETIVQTAATPLTVGIFGPWGSGKTSLMSMVQKKIEEQPLGRVRTVWFTAWKYDRHEVLWRAFVLRVLNALYPREEGPGLREERPIVQKPGPKQAAQIAMLQRLEQSVYKEVEWQELGERTINWWQLISNSAEIGVDIASVFVPGAESFKKLLNLVRSENKTDKAVQQAVDAVSRDVIAYHREQLFHTEQFEKTFAEAIKEILGENGRLIVFVDDLDRCLPEKAIEILEAIKLFLEVPGAVFVLGMDQRVIQAGISARYGSLFHQQLQAHIELPIRGDSYLQKIVQIPFYLPALATESLLEFITAQDKNLPGATDQVFAQGLYPNPRQVKRALNIFRLLQQIALAREERGALDAGSIAWPLLAKTVIIQTQYPDLYQLWRQVPTLLQTLEDEYTRRPLSLEEMVRGGITVPDDADEKDAPTAAEGRGGLLDPYLKNRWQYARLAQLLTFQPEDGQAREGRDKVLFAGLNPIQMAAYVRLAGAVGATAAAQEEALAAIPQDRLAQLLSGDLALVQNAAAELETAEPQPDGPQRGAVQGQLLKVLQDQSEAAQVRVSAGMALGLLGDPREEVLDVDKMQFCLVPPGPFWMGSEEKDNEKPLHLNAALDYEYWIGRDPVTVAQFQSFVAADGYADDAIWSEAAQAGYWKAGKYRDRTAPNDFGRPFDLPNHPVVGISWYEALAFCRWLTKRWQQRGRLPTDWRVQLPSEAEWEKAARGGVDIPPSPVVADTLQMTERKQFEKNQRPAAMLFVENPQPQRRFPWDTELTPELAHYKETGIESSSAVGAFPANLSPYGVGGLSGNCYEWTRSLDKRYEYDPADGREAINASNDSRILRGGYFGDEATWLRCASRGWLGPYRAVRYVGLRVVVSPFFNR